MTRAQSFVDRNPKVGLWTIFSSGFLGFFYPVKQDAKNGEPLAEAGHCTVSTASDRREGPPSHPRTVISNLISGFATGIKSNAWPCPGDVDLTVGRSGNGVGPVLLRSVRAFSFVADDAA